MNQKLKADVLQRDDVTYVKLAGVIDEDNDLSNIMERIGPGTCAIDLSSIERINSCGVRDWVNWLGKVEKAGAKSVLLECSPAIVAQINLVNNFTGGGVVKSFYAPYFCPSCDLEKVLLIDTQEMVDVDQPKAPTCRCDECDGVMDFDDMDSYFAFVSTMRNRVLFHPKVDAVISELSPSDGERKIRSRSNTTSGGSITTGSGAGSTPGSGARSAGGVGLAAATSHPGAMSTGVRSFGGKTGPGAGNTPVSSIGMIPPVSMPSSRPGSNKAYGLAIVLLLLVAAGLLIYAFLFAGPKERKSVAFSSSISQVVSPGAARSASPYYS